MAELAALPTTLPAAPRNAAFPGALLVAVGAFLIVWALRDWGAIE